MNREKNGENLIQAGEMALDLAHEVRNAVTAVSGALRIIEEALPPESRKICSAIHKRLQDLDRMADDLQTLCNPTEFARAAISLRGVLDRAAAQIKQEQSDDEPDMAIVIHTSGDDVTVMADDRLLTRLFYALYQCAIPAVSPGTALEVQVIPDNRLCRVTVHPGPAIHSGKNRLLWSMAQCIAARHDGHVARGDSAAGEPGCIVELPLP